MSLVGRGRNPSMSRERWGSGPWDDEDDRYEGAMGTHTHCFPAVIGRSPTGSLLGYIGVLEGHPWFGKHDGDDQAIDDIVVHGGVTYTGPARPAETFASLTKPDGLDVWWIGFDCAHFTDLLPIFADGTHPLGGIQDLPMTYRDLAFVIGELETMVVQAVWALELADNLVGPFSGPTP